jgi:hypothetical protein
MFSSFVGGILLLEQHASASHQSRPKEYLDTLGPLIFLL